MRLLVPVFLLLAIVSCKVSSSEPKETEYFEADELPCHILLNPAMTLEKISVLPEVFNATYRDSVSEAILYIDVLTLNDSARVLKAYTNRINMIDRNIDTFIYDIKYVDAGNISVWLMKSPYGRLPIQFAATDSASVMVAGKVKFLASERDTDIINNVEQDIVYLMKNINVS